MKTDLAEGALRQFAYDIDFSKGKKIGLRFYSLIFERRDNLRRKTGNSTEAHDNANFENVSKVVCVGSYCTIFGNRM